MNTPRDWYEPDFGSETADASEQQVPVRKVGWWRRIGAAGQIAIVTALIGVVSAGIPAAVTEGFGLFRDSGEPPEGRGDPGKGPVVSTTVPTTVVPTSTSTSTSTEASPSISFSIMNQLTAGLSVEVLEENIYIQLGDQGEKIWLKSTPDDPVSVEYWTADYPDDYRYTLDVSMTLRDGYGNVWVFSQSTTGSVYITDGATLTVMLYFDDYGQLINMELGQG
jgi:hypothetical protein